MSCSVLRTPPEIFRLSQGVWALPIYPSLFTWQLQKLNELLLWQADCHMPADCELEFVGKDFVDDDGLARLLGLNSQARPMIKSNL